MFDVCADDHCQRYQGITRASTPLVVEVINETWGEILTDGETICDTRFYKCCGGITEQFENVWEPVPHPYLTAVRDAKGQSPLPDLSIETAADTWIRTSPEAFCNTHDKEILSQVLNNYDQETSDFYRWKVVYTQKKLSELITRKSGGIDFGDIIDLVPLKRGTSGRIEKLKIVGSKQTYTIGKELEIRRVLSESHLYSSAFVVDKEDISNAIPGRFVLTGAGWGHGVGLCQIGAAVMGAQGYNYKQILAHYFPHTEIERRY
jgi:SpoIID/LytB domain protein